MSSILQEVMCLVYYRKCCNEIHKVIIPHTGPNVDDSCVKICAMFVCGPPWSMLVGVEGSSLSVQRWKLMVIKLQLQVTIFFYKSREEPSSCDHQQRVVTIDKVRQRSLDF